MVSTLARSSLLVASAAGYDNGSPHSRLPPLGWSSWEALGAGTEHAVRDYCDENSVKAAADAFIETGLFDAGYRHFHLDDCWSIVQRTVDGRIQPDPTRFPNGMKPAIDYVHSKGLTFGLYTSGGSSACQQGRAGSRGHWEQDAQSFAEWGVDWVKMDWCGGQDLHGSYGNMSKALNATGRQIAFNMCEWGQQKPWEWGYELAQSWRITKDHSAKWTSTKDTIRAMMNVPKEHGGRPWGWNDMDMLQTGNSKPSGRRRVQPAMTDTEHITEFSMWAIAASPLLVTTPIMNCTMEPSPSPGPSPTPVNPPKGKCVGVLSDIQKKVLLNKEMIAINQDDTPQGFPVMQGDSTVWARNLSDGSIAVALYNEDDASKTIGGTAFTQLGWSNTTSVRVRDLWAHTDNGTETGALPKVTVEAHSTVVLRLNPLSSVFV